MVRGARALGQPLVDAEVPVEMAGFGGAAFGSGEEATAAGGALVGLVGVEGAEELRAEGFEGCVGGWDDGFASCGGLSWWCLGDSAVGV